MNTKPPFIAIMRYLGALLITGVSVFQSACTPTQAALPVTSQRDGAGASSVETVAPIMIPTLRLPMSGWRLASRRPRRRHRSDRWEGLLGREPLLLERRDAHTIPPHRTKDRSTLRWR